MLLLHLYEEKVNSQCLVQIITFGILFSSFTYYQ